MLIQYERPGRDKSKVKHLCAILYLPVAAEARAARIIEAENTGDKSKLQKGDTMDISITKMVVAPCNEDEQDRQYDNQRNEAPCLCSTCLENPPISKILPCNCSRCLPEPVPIKKPKPRAVAESAALMIPQSERLSKAMHVIAKEHMLSYRLALFDAKDERTSGFTPLTSYLPAKDIQLILDTYTLLLTNGELQICRIFAHNNYILYNIDGFVKVLQTAEKDLAPICTANQEKERVGRATSGYPISGALSPNYFVHNWG
ncbi:hypothetical protein HWV62_25016 [Athelia sp. TMB]|nr:hypothetical protein HWV62_25016 [Athelia sp. TMB]